LTQSRTVLQSANELEATPQRVLTLNEPAKRIDRAGALTWLAIFFLPSLPFCLAWERNSGTLGIDAASPADISRAAIFSGVCPSLHRGHATPK